MKVVGLVVVVVAVLILAAVSFAQPAANPQQKQIAALQAQLKQLKSQVKQLQGSSTKLEADLLANYQGDACGFAATADALQGTWSVIDDMSKKAGGAAYFGAQSPASDRSGCLVGVTRQTGVVPPKIDPLQTLINWLAE